MKRPSAPLALSLVALFFALTGVGVAAQHTPDPTARASAVKTTTVYGDIATMCASSTQFQKCEIATSGAVCPPGTVVTGGGWVGVHGTYALDARVTISAPYKTFAWDVEMDNHDTSSARFRAVAVCASG